MSREYVQPSMCLRVPSSVSLHRCIAWSACASTSIAPFPGNFQKTPDSTRRESAAPWNLCIGPWSRDQWRRIVSRGGIPEVPLRHLVDLRAPLLCSALPFPSLYALRCVCNTLREQKTLRTERRERCTHPSSRRDMGRYGETWGAMERCTPSSSCRRPPPPTQSRSRAISRDLG